MTDKEMMKNIDKKAVGERIRGIRLRQGLTLAAFGEQFCAKKKQCTTMGNRCFLTL